MALLVEQTYLKPAKYLILV